MGAGGSSGVIVTPAATATLPLPASGPLETSLHLSKPISASVPGDSSAKRPSLWAICVLTVPSQWPAPCTLSVHHPLSPRFPLQQTPSSPGSRCP